MPKIFDFIGTLLENGKRVLTTDNVPDIIEDALEQAGESSSEQIGDAMAKHLGVSNPHNITPELIGAASLDENGKVPESQLPSYVDDVIEYDGMSKFPTTGESGKIYVDTNENKSYRWSGSTYVVIAGSVALGTTSSTAFRGDLGNVAYEHSQEPGNPHGLLPTDIGLGNVVDTGDSDIPVEGGKTKFTTGGAFTELNKKVSVNNFNDHVNNPVHITSEEREKWDNAYTLATENSNKSTILSGTSVPDDSIGNDGDIYIMYS